jgi:hypothetical protein
VRGFLHRTHRCGETDALRALPGNVIEALKAERKVGSPLGIGDRMDFVEMTVSMWRSTWRACEVRSRKRDSGVVIRMSGGTRANRRRSSAGVSPVRTATRMSGTSRFIRSQAVRMPNNGERRFRSMSMARAFSGDTYKTPSRALGSTVGLRVRRSMAHRKAARVLPEPVGATTSVSSPDAIASQAPSWARVGAANDDVNHERVGSEKSSSGE